MSREIIVTGACGFLGRHMARFMAEKGYVVKGIGHGSWRSAEWRSWGLDNWLQGEVTVDSLHRFANSPRSIIHCAGGGSVPFSVANPLLDFERTVLTTANVLDYVRTHSPDTRVAYPSSASIYGITPGRPIREDSPAAPISPYGVHKWLTEQLIVLYARQYGISAAIVRLFSIYGPGLRKQLLWDACQKLSSGKESFMGTGDEVRDWLEVSDAAELLSLAADNATARCPVVNGGTGEGVSVRELVEYLSQRPCLNGSHPSFSGERRVGDPQFYVANIEKATRWGWTPKKDWRRGVSEYADWWRADSERVGASVGASNRTNV